MVRTFIRVDQNVYKCLKQRLNKLKFVGKDGGDRKGGVREQREAKIEEISTKNTDSTPLNIRVEAIAFGTTHITTNPAEN